MLQAKTGDTVRVHYTVRLEDGTVFDSSRGGEPLQFTLGEGQVVPGFESVVEGMRPGETKTAWFPPDYVYGPHRDELVLVVGRERFSGRFEPEAGQLLRMRRQGVPPVLVRVVDVEGEVVTLDANHPLAGRELTFDLELLEIA